MRVDSYPALFSLVEYVLAEGGRPLLSSFVDQAVHWRLVVVGDQALGAYRNTMEQDDFRTSGGHHDEDYRVAPPPGAAELAVRACHALRAAHGGVDILEHPSGRLYLLEANFPCYYPQAQLAVGTDIAGAMVDFMLAEAQRHAPVVEGPLPRLTN